MKLSQAQGKALLSWRLKRDFGYHKWTTVESLMKLGYLSSPDGKRIDVTPMGHRWCENNHMRITL